MKVEKWCLLLLVIFSGFAQAMDGVFDRSSEVAKYIEQFNGDLSREQMIDVAKSVYVSGIGDEKLTQAIGERLLKDIRDLNDYRTASQYGSWMVKALGSTGNDVARDYIISVCKKTAVQSIVSECKQQLKELAWERRKNEIMSSRKNFSEGDDMRVAQMLNLLKSNDLTYQMDAAYRMSWDKILDDRLMREIAEQLQLFVNKHGVAMHKREYALISNYCKLLGYSHNDKYKPLLLAVTKTEAPEILVRAQAKKAIKRIDDKEANSE